MRQNISVEDALESILSQARPIAESESVPLSAAFQRVLAQDLPSRVFHPDADDSAVDGYAVRGEETITASVATPVRLEVVGEAPAGRPFAGEVQRGQAVAIYTGAPIPKGANAVVRVEDTVRDGSGVWLLKPASPADIRHRGDDLRQGEVYLHRGTWLNAARVALAAAMGYPSLPVVRRPRVGILSTGDEVVEPGQPLPYGGVYNSNSYALAGQVQEAGGEAVVLGKVPDSLEALGRSLAGVGLLDVLLTSGGVSMGKYDLVRQMLEKDGRIHFWKVKIQPGGPVLFAEYRGLPVLGLPGNPVSSMVVFHLFGRALLFKLLGRSDAPYAGIQATAATAFGANPSKRAYRRGILRWTPEGFTVETTGNQSSGVLRSMVEGNALVMLEPGESARVGDRVTVIPLGFTV
ncbi:gephyrin-like molybdotransferase Glp [Calidithermus roseus]|uniref:Molybdopterin molybdenumtransferase n=1 Tax=Calidithermus roseus TaxID=1644118 RepID=A0A399EHT3_9DEIN|nr:gephyrin-like molybdotransferase Glp [Calidithermus roseus]RIH84207.1 Molybdopterin molybdenumtransferase [Calidithermus roseus]